MSRSLQHAESLALVKSTQLGPVTVFLRDLTQLGWPNHWYQQLCMLSQCTRVTCMLGPCQSLCTEPS